jgi:hypothetical protein
VSPLTEVSSSLCGSVFADLTRYSTDREGDLGVGLRLLLDRIKIEYVITTDTKKGDWPPYILIFSHEKSVGSTNTVHRYVPDILDVDGEVSVRTFIAGDSLPKDRSLEKLCTPKQIPAVFYNSARETSCTLALLSGGVEEFSPVSVREDILGEWFKFYS